MIRTKPAEGTVFFIGTNPESHWDADQYLMVFPDVVHLVEGVVRIPREGIPAYRWLAAKPLVKVKLNEDLVPFQWYVERKARKARALVLADRRKARREAVMAEAKARSVESFNSHLKVEDSE